MKFNKSHKRETKDTKHNFERNRSDQIRKFTSWMQKIDQLNMIE